MLAGNLPGGDVRAFLQILAARTLTPTPNDGALYSAVVQRTQTNKIINDCPAQVNSVAFSPDDRRLVTGCADGTVRIWMPTPGQPLSAPLTGHTDAVASVAFSPDGHRFASSAADKTVRLWDADTGRALQPSSPVTVAR